MILIRGKLPEPKRCIGFLGRHYINKNVMMISDGSGYEYCVFEFGDGQHHYLFVEDFKGSGRGVGHHVCK